jgi:acetyl-CoA carboxylase biotin carboxyl carrier protein
VELEFNELRELLTVINQTDIVEFILKSGEFELMIRKGTPLGEYLPPTNGSASGSVSSPPSPQSSLPSVVANPAPSSPPRSNEKLVTVTAPMVGTFYRSPAPDEPPFVNMGDRIRLGQTVCIIEAMKLMNELEAEVAGEIVEILANNGDPVEYGQVLMRVNPG